MLGRSSNTQSDKLKDVRWHPSPLSHAPILENALEYRGVSFNGQVPAGDSIVLVGEVIGRNRRTSMSWPRSHARDRFQAFWLEPISRIHPFKSAAYRSALKSGTAFTAASASRSALLRPRIEYRTPLLYPRAPKASRKSPTTRYRSRVGRFVPTLRTTGFLGYQPFEANTFLTVPFPRSCA